MEDSFRVRADKVFGSLGGDTTSSEGVSSFLWCLGDEEIQRREWNRNKDYPKEEDEGDVGLDYEPPVVRNPLLSDLQELSDDDEEEEEEGEEIDGGNKKRRRNVSTSDETCDDEYFEVQSSIGLDCTLDFEEEEDQYDKVAVGVTGDRLYMSDVKTADYETQELNDYNGLPNTFQDVVRDPRANHMAAKIRLKEDAEAAGNFHMSRCPDDNTSAKNTDTKDLNKREVDADNPKPILKRGENLMDSKSQKHVRFVFDPNTSNQTHEDHQTSSDTCESENYVMQQQAPDLSPYSSGIPDYLRNPSKYTCYAFDMSDDTDDQANRKAYMEFFDKLRKRSSDSEDMSVETSKLVVFTPRRKMEEGSAGKRSEHASKRLSVGVTAEEISEESEVSVMEEDEPCPAAVVGGTLGKPGRQYRARANADFDGDSN